jgi:hypothetical protein
MIQSGLFRNEQPGGQVPGKTRRVEKLWDEQAWKNNVYPLYDDVSTRFAKQFARAFGGRKTFTCVTRSANRAGGPEV